ncbi:MAG: hypothetical protein GY945_03105 [Rhodobacteraceae bacterium]|nr:hypothetical protein [Paracoccaceae bacterium]
MSERATLNRIRNRITHAPHGWQLEPGDHNFSLKANPANNNDDPFPITFATVANHDFEVAEFLFSAHGDIVFLLGLVDRAIAKIKNGHEHSSGNEAKPEASAEAARVSRARAGPAQAGIAVSANKDYAAQAAIACTKPAFVKFLGQRFGVDDPDPDQTTDMLLQELDISSRSELNAAGRWMELNQQFNTWLNTPAGNGR